MLADLRYAIRQLLRAPGFTLVAALTLALGIGANATAFSVVDALLLRPTPHVLEPERLVALYTSDYSGPTYGTSAYADLEDFARAGRAAGVFVALAGYGTRPAAVGDEASRERVVVEAVGPGYLELLGVRPTVGRAFTDEEARGAGASAVVISDALWRRRFGADPGVIGRTLPVNARPATVVGVLPPKYGGSTRAVAVDVWVPLAVAPRLRIEGVDPESFTSRGSRAYEAVARLAPGVSIERARQAMDVVARQLHAAYPQSWSDVRNEVRRITVLSEREARVPPSARGPVLAFTGLLGVSVGLVLLVCCANVAGLLLARGTGRGREIGVRLSLGARPARLARQLLTESVALSALGTAIALVLTAWATRLITQLHPTSGVPFSLDVAPDWRVLVFSAALAVVAEKTCSSSRRRSPSSPRWRSGSRPRCAPRAPTSRASCAPAARTARPGGARGSRARSSPASSRRRSCCSSARCSS
jgi:predicted permease